MIYWKVSACQIGKSCLTTDFTTVLSNVIITINKLDHEIQLQKGK